MYYEKISNINQRKITFKTWKPFLLFTEGSFLRLNIVGLKPLCGVFFFRHEPRLAI